MKVTNVRLPDKLVDEIDDLSKRHTLSRSELIRQALIVYLHIIENVGTLLRPIAFQVKPSQITYTRKGDVTIIKIPTGHAIVVGSTSSGSIGPKPMDKLKVEARILGKFLARVALMDVAATGAFPIMLSVTLGVEKEPTGKEIIEGIRNEARILGSEPNQFIMENTEDNFQTVQTGVGLTVVGFANEEDIRIGKTMPGDLVVAVGKPKVGKEVLLAEVRSEIADLQNVITLTQKKFVHDIATVGTFGIAYEAQMMAQAVGRQLELVKPAALDLEKSAGPATVILVTIDSEKLEDLKQIFQKPFAVVGKIL